MGRPASPYALFWEASPLLLDLQLLDRKSPTKLGLAATIQGRGVQNTQKRGDCCANPPQMQASPPTWNKRTRRAAVSNKDLNQGSCHIRR